MKSLYVTTKFLLIPIFTFTVSSFATIINIPADYPTIQEGIDASADGDTVLVQPGTYIGTGNIDLDLLGKPIRVMSASGPDSTIIDCQGSSGNAHRAFYLRNNEDTTSVIDGFTITGGFAHSRGGGIYCNNASPLIVNCRFGSNRSNYHGGGIYITGGSPAAIKYCNFFQNYAYGSGGAVYIDSSSVIIDSCMAGLNYANGGGGGFYFWASNGLIRNCMMGSNSGMYGCGIGCFFSDSLYFINCTFGHNDWGGLCYGGGAYCRKSPANFINCSFSHNLASYGGGIYCEYGSDLTLIDCLIESNWAWDYYGGGVAAVACTAITMLNCVVTSNHGSPGGGIALMLAEMRILNSIIRSNEPSDIFNLPPSELYIDYSNIQGGWPGTGNIDVDPFFRDPANGNFHLMSIACGDSADSPCIDTGDPAILDSLLDCSWGLGGPRSDMGAYGGGDSLITTIFDNMPSMPDRFVLFQNYPNPFNSETKIEFTIVNSAVVRLAVYDLLGREVQTLVDEYKHSGLYTATFEANNLSSGIYYCRLQVGEVVKTNPMVLLR